MVVRRGVDKVRPVLKKLIEFHFSSLYSVTDIEFNGERYWIILSYSDRISYIIYWGSTLSIIIQKDRIKVLNREFPKVILIEIMEKLNPGRCYLD